MFLPYYSVVYGERMLNGNMLPIGRLCGLLSAIRKKRNQEDISRASFESCSIRLDGHGPMVIAKQASNCNVDPYH